MVPAEPRQPTRSVPIPISSRTVAAPDAPPSTASGTTRYRGRSATMRTMVRRGLNQNEISGGVLSSSASDDMTTSCIGATARVTRLAKVPSACQHGALVGDWLQINLLQVFGLGWLRRLSPRLCNEGPPVGDPSCDAHQSLNGSNSFSPAIATANGRKVWTALTEPACSASTSGRRR